MASPQWKPFQPPNNHENATNSPIGRSFSSSFMSSFTNSMSLSNRNHSSKSNCSPSASSSYQIHSSDNGTNSDQLSSSPGASQDFREAGIVEKLLPSYGFIQCCERQARLFFHYSQFNGNIEHLKLGDPVEFEMTCDRRTGKPIASSVMKISSEAALIGEELSSDPVTGFITIEVTDDKEGRVAYENRGECFFLPFTKEDVVEPSVELKAKDRVIFHIATDKSGNLRARQLSLESPTPQRFEGVVCTLKDSFGFIERADIVKEIFFHSSECKDFKNLVLGDDVEFSVQTRNNKEVAVNVTRLAPGSVVFEDVSGERFTGQIVKTVDRYSNHSYLRQHSNSTSSSTTGSESPFPGLLRYKNGSSDVELPFGERDVKGEFTLQVGDWVTFNIVTDRRDQLKHATNIDLYDESFILSGERRDQGYIAALKDSYGFIKCLNRDGTRVYFKISEMLDPNLPIKLNDEVEFTIAPDMSSPGRLQAIRIKALANGTIIKNLLSMSQSSSNSSAQNNASSKQPSFSTSIGQASQNGYQDTQSISAYCNSVMDKSSENQSEFPLIDLNPAVEIPHLSPKALPNETSHSSSRVFNIKSDSWSEILSQLSIADGYFTGEPSPQSDLLSSAEQDASPVVNTYPDYLSSSKSVSVDKKQDQNGFCDRNGICNVNGADHYYPVSFGTKNGIKNGLRGFVAALKDSFGFIESEDHQTEIFFHYSVYDGSIQDLDLGHEVEYSAAIKNSKLSAEYVRRLEGRSVESEKVLPDVLNGKLVRSCRCLNPDQNEYCGLIEVINSTPGSETEYEFSMTSLADIHDYVQKGDLVTFQVGVDKEKATKRAVNIKPVREKHHATVDAIKGNFGFLNYEVEDGKKLFFHMSEVKGESVALHPGETVEFVVVHNQRSGKYSACSVVKQSESTQRPERLINRIKASDESSGPKIVLIRQPKGPDGSKGFNIPRQSKA